MTKPLSVLLAIVCLSVVHGALSSAYAYLDPGTGTMLIQGVIAFVAGAAALISSRLSRFKAFFNRKNKASKIDGSDK